MKTHISVVLDRSGSMADTKSDTIGGFNQFLQDQKDVEGEATLTLAQFDDHYEVLSDMVPIVDAVDLTNETYTPRGYTALLDALGRTINDTEHKISQEREKPERVIFVVITDGEENSSREFTRDQIMEMINRHRDEDEWEFVFIGANQDAIQAGGSLGVRDGSTMNYVASPIGTQTMYRGLSQSLTNYRTSAIAPDEFFSEEDKKEVEELDEKPDAKDIDNLYHIKTTNLSENND